MGMNVGAASGGEHEEVIAAINTTPLVDVMLVLLIIFLITIPVVTHTVPVQVPKETVHPLKTTPHNVVLAVNRAGNVFWNETRVPDIDALVARLKSVAVQSPQPEVQIRGDQAAHYEYVGKVVVACQRAGIAKIAFITEPPARGG
ncbi:ExbD/TolR family protein [Paraburkholderia unamae]|jgi:biopolymer transport protein ExbD|uniref:Outer membrane transport energization protein ExbD n=1 Tax=Paraburkholderia unamae TaxID=219649 RepID=A0ABX5K6I0_9BURK|nr:biopolymer transporter ExbD [Paraburkholderia unamae]PVX61043.1 outer membrane transport energization protein ExbD [Paraburkholderia unamae]CAG9266303.1 Biopolymer transport protein ExbD/TolR [Paraburkholderia unamae]